MSKGRQGDTYANGYPSWYLVNSPGGLYANLWPPDEVLWTTGRSWKHIDKKSLEILIEKFQMLAADMDYLPDDHDADLCDGAVSWHPDSRHRGQQSPVMLKEMFNQVPLEGA